MKVCGWRAPPVTIAASARVPGAKNAPRVMAPVPAPAMPMVGTIRATRNVVARPYR